MPPSSLSAEQYDALVQDLAGVLLTANEQRSRRGSRAASCTRSEYSSASEGDQPFDANFLGSSQQKKKAQKRKKKKTQKVEKKLKKQEDKQEKMSAEGKLISVRLVNNLLAKKDLILRKATDTSTLRPLWTLGPLTADIKKEIEEMKMKNTTVKDLLQTYKDCQLKSVQMSTQEVKKALDTLASLGQRSNRTVSHKVMGIVGVVPVRNRFKRGVNVTVTKKDESEIPYGDKLLCEWSLQVYESTESVRLTYSQETVPDQPNAVIYYTTMTYTPGKEGEKNPMHVFANNAEQNSQQGFSW